MNPITHTKSTTANRMNNNNRFFSFAGYSKPKSTNHQRQKAIRMLVTLGSLESDSARLVYVIELEMRGHGPLLQARACRQS
jgi:hypothetical protein